MGGQDKEQPRGHDRAITTKGGLKRARTHTSAISAAYFESGQGKCRVGQRPAYRLAPADLVLNNQLELVAHARHLYQPGSRQTRVDLPEVHGGYA